jgi:hypothetical protein
MLIERRAADEEFIACWTNCEAWDDLVFCGVQWSWALNCCTSARGERGIKGAKIYKWLHRILRDTNIQEYVLDMGIRHVADELLVWAVVRREMGCYMQIRGDF